MKPVINPEPPISLNEAHQAMWDAGSHWEDDDFNVLVLTGYDADEFIGDDALKNRFRIIERVIHGYRVDS